MKISNSDINFRAGLTSRMQREIAAADVKRIKLSLGVHFGALI